MPGILEKFGIQQHLIIDFLGTFARFEYALKRSGYVKGDENGLVADWDRFGNFMAALNKEALTPILASCDYLRTRPPKKQVLQDGKLAWKVRRSPGGPRIQEVLLSVRTVRNNVFHGGKFPHGPVEEPLRDEQLIQDCVSVLNALLLSPDLPNGIADYFWSEG